MDLADQLEQEQGSECYPGVAGEELTGDFPQAEESQVLTAGDDGPDDHPQEHQDLDPVPHVGASSGGPDVAVSGVQALLFTSHESTTFSMVS